MNKILGWVKRRLQRSALILMYHRINDRDSDPWGLCVQPGHFAEHLNVLRRVAVPLSLREFVSAHQTRSLPNNAVAITFDDGYADNLSKATPVLERFDIPATVFITSGYVGSKREFWWDELEQVLLRPCRLPETLELPIGGKNCRWDTGEAALYLEADYQRELNQKAWDGKPGSRHGLYYALWQALQPLDNCARLSLLDAIATWAGARPEARVSRRALDQHELQSLARSGLIEIGAHSVSHPLLPAHPLSVQCEEIRESKKYLENLLDSPVTSFAYPHGSYTGETLAIVKAAGFRCACTTAERLARPGTRCLELPRFQVEDWSGDEFLKRLQFWLGC